MTVIAEGRGEAPDWGRRYDIKHLWTEVAPGLWQGGTADNDVVDFSRRSGVLPTDREFGFSEDRPAIQPSDFDAVVTLYAFARPVGWEVEELRWGIYDSEFGALDAAGIKETVDWVHRRWNQGKKVLIRCQAGLNRSGLITALVLVKSGMEPQDAINLLRDTRSRRALFNTKFERFILGTPVSFWRGLSA